MTFVFRKSWLILFAVFVFAAGSITDAQTKRPRPTAKKTPPPTVSPTPEPVKPEPIPETQKRNERPKNGTQAVAAPIVSPAKDPFYRYEFTQPDFIISHIVIEHDDSGKGTIAFKRRSFDEMLSEPIEVSAPTLEKLKAAFATLNFIDSTEDYQYERDFSNMGNVAITLKNEGRERTAKYNWTSNKEAKFLMDEYRRIGNQFTWMFDFNLARENQPLETPKLVDNLDALLKRNEIADPRQMLPFLQAVSNDERVPLIGRNHAGKLVKQIEKQKK